MRFTNFIARRFALGGKGAVTSRVTGWIAILGMAIGSFALVVAVSVLQGFESSVIEKIIGFESDLRISGELTPVQTDNIKRDQKIRLLQPYLERKGLIKSSDNNLRLVTFKAIDLESIGDFYQISIRNTFLYKNEPKIFIGKTLAIRLNAMEGDKITLLSPVDVPGPFGVPKIINATIAGIFSADVLQFDDDYAFISMKTGFQLFSRKDGYDGYDVRLTDSTLAAEVKSEILSEYPTLGVETWSEMHASLFSAMQMERIGAILILSLIILVAAFNLATTLILVSSQKANELGILRAMGVDKINIEQIIFRQGILIGGSGAIGGFLLGTLIVTIQTIFQPITLPADIYLTPILPVQLTSSAVITIISIATIAVWAASKLAARRLRYIDPIHALFLEK